MIARQGRAIMLDKLRKTLHRCGFSQKSHSAPIFRPERLAEKLGYRPNARLLIVHADDLGFAKAVNEAFFAALKTGLVNSGSAMVPCPWFSEIAAFAREHPETDIGLHLTLTSETDAHKWQPSAGPEMVPSLVDDEGFLRKEWRGGARINLRDVERELRAQIDKAYESGLHPTHIDSHQFCLQKRGDRLFDVYARLGREYGLPILVTPQWFSQYPYIENASSLGYVLLDRVATIPDGTVAEEWSPYYTRLLRSLQPGVTELLIHPGYDQDDFRNLLDGRLSWGAAWRQRDFDFFTSEAFRSLLLENDIALITWRDISNALH
jgi:predicted glycoside hydrolase/deacetylase ChbG (UPF0249 family)